LGNASWGKRLGGGLFSGTLYIYGIRSAKFSGLVIYAVLAFGGQLPVGLWLDRNRNLQSFGICSIILLLLAGLIFFVDPFWAIIVAGFASAGIHVVGGCVCLMLNKEKIAPLSIFTAPGVAGLTLGGFCGMLNGNWIMLPLTMASVLLVLIVKNGFPVYLLHKSENSPALERHDMLMISLLLIMCLRSFLFDLLNSFSGQIEYGLLVAGLSTFAGKIIGGLFADKIGWKRWIYITLPLAFILLQLGHNNIIAMGFGVACLQSSVPITLQLLYNSMPAYPATAAALSLGSIVALSGLPLYALPNLNYFFSSSLSIFILLIAVILIVISFAFLMYVRQRRKLVTL